MNCKSAHKYIILRLNSKVLIQLRNLEINVIVQQICSFQSRSIIKWNVIKWNFEQNL